MIFTDSVFFTFLPIVFFAYLATRKHLTLNNLVLLVSSYIFYAHWDWRFCSLLALSSLVDFYCGNRIQNSNNRIARRRYLTVSMCVNLGILAIFKYFDFFIASLSIFLADFGIEYKALRLDIILPVGISFYTFQTMTYAIDIYRREMRASNSLLNYLTYVSFFPQLVAGPIERARNLLPQLERQREISIYQITDGLRQILAGLFKKVVIADNVAPMVDAIFAKPELYTSPELLVAAWLFGVQIYCDFSGYSDIAIGTGKLFGINLMQNFRTPYFALSLSDFWRRWHISLSTFFRDYLFIPLGGSQVARHKVIGNVLTVFLLSGLWHGANYTFLLWGFWHGLGLSLAIIFGWYAGYLGKWSALFRNRVFGFIATTLFVICGWIFFRAPDWASIRVIYVKLMDISTYANFGSVDFANYLVPVFAGMTIYLFDAIQVNQKHLLEVDRFAIPVRGLVYFGAMLSLFLLGSGTTTGFIYFQF